MARTKVNDLTAKSARLSGSIPSYMNLVHKELMAKYVTNGNIKQKRKEAEMLQNFFRKLKSAYMGINRTNRKQYTNQNAKDLGRLFADDALGQVYKSLETLNPKVMGKMFKQNKNEAGGQFMNRGGWGYGTNLQSGENFEKEFGRILQAILYSVATDSSKMKISNLDWKDKNEIWVGRNPAHTFDKDFGYRIKKICDEIAENFKKQGAKELIEDIKEMGLNLEAETDGIVKSSGREQKVDVKGIEIKIKAKANKELSEIAKIIKNSSFSLKNYKMDESGKIKWDITLGRTNIFKAYYGTLSDANGKRIVDEDSAIVSSFCHGYYSYKKYGGRTSENIGKHFYHIRTIYELIGAGLKDSDGNSLKDVDFFVFNNWNNENPNSAKGGIYIRSTYDIIKDVLNNSDEWQIKYPFGSIRMKRSVMGAKTPVHDI